MKINPFAICYEVKYKDEHFFVAMNANPEITQQFSLPKGDWEVLVDNSKAGVKPFKVVKNKVDLEPTSGTVLKKK